jgi:hypothetical protein
MEEEEAAASSLDMDLFRALEQDFALRLNLVRRKKFPEQLKTLLLVTKMMMQEEEEEEEQQQHSC